jgi:hypothetical protein
MSERRYQYEKRMATNEEVDHEILDDDDEIGAPYYLYEGEWARGFVSVSFVTAPPYLRHNRTLKKLFHHWKRYSEIMRGQKRARTLREDLY